jgi:hypothetical protein
MQAAPPSSLFLVRIRQFNSKTGKQACHSYRPIHALPTKSVQKTVPQPEQLYAVPPDYWGEPTVRQLWLLSSIALVAPAVLGASLAYGQRVNKDLASSIMPGCRDFVATRKGDAFARGLCVGLVKNLFEYAPNICPPEGLKNDQIVRVIVRYVDSDPARLQEDFNGVAAEAMRKAWPCQR